MMDVLLELGERPGVLGCLVATTDGMVVASRLGNGLDEEAAAALVSSLLAGTLRLLKACGEPRMENLVLRASRGKILVTDLVNAYLVVVTDRQLDLDQGLLDVESAARQLRRLGKIPSRTVSPAK